MEKEVNAMVTLVTPSHCTFSTVGGKTYYGKTIQGIDVGSIVTLQVENHGR